jgi:hypothetical protein
MESKRLTFELLRSMYHPNGHGLVSLQTEGACQAFGAIIKGASDEMVSVPFLLLYSSRLAISNPGLYHYLITLFGISLFCAKASGGTLFGSDDYAAIISAANDADGKGHDLLWFPEYGCVLIMVHKTGVCSLPGKIYLTVLGLDRHEMATFGDCGSNATDRTFTSNSDTYANISCGVIEVNEKEGFLKAFRALFSSASQREGDDRSAWGGRGAQQGHQKTPAFISALLEQVADDLEDKESNVGIEGKKNDVGVAPKGGFTDVGMHTGGCARNTSWPLARSVFHWALTQHAKSGFFVVERVMACFHLTLFKHVVQSSELRQNWKMWKGVSWSILSAGCLAAVDLQVKEVSQFKADLFLGALEVVKGDFMGIIEGAECEKAKLFAFDEENDSSKWRQHYLELPEKQHHDKAPLSAEEQHKSLCRNISWLPVLCSAAVKFVDLHTWLTKSMKYMSPSMHLTELCIMRQVEVFFLRQIEVVLKNGRAADESEIEQMSDALNLYREVVDRFFRSEEHSALLQTELRSRELLVVWGAYCIVHSTLKIHYGDVVHGYGLAINYKDLCHLVLQEEKWRIGTSTVAKYVQENTVPKREMFSLDTRAQDNSFEIGRRYAKKYLMHIWDVEQRDAESRIDGHWRKVKRQKVFVRGLKSQKEIMLRDKRTQDEACETARRNRDSCSYHSNSWYVYENNHVTLVSESRQLANRISGVESEIKQEEMAPRPVMQPLPKSEEASLSVLFFLHMPCLFRHVARLGLMAQQMLVPRPWVAIVKGEDGTEECDVFEKIKVAQSGTTWSTYYNAQRKETEYHTSVQTSDGVNGEVQLAACGTPPPPKEVGPDNIWNLKTRSQGVWYPDGLFRVIIMTWSGGSLAFDQHDLDLFNPFEIDKSFVVSYFTERLGVEPTLQWTMRQGGDDMIRHFRGNRGLATQHNKPSWLSKEGYQAFCGFRSFPRGQLRKVCNSFAERYLDVGHTGVQTVIRQALYHLGDIEVIEGKVEFCWKRDLRLDLLQHFFSLLFEFSRELQECPSNSGKASFVGEVALFLSSWYGGPRTEFKDVARSMANALLQWSAHIDADIEKAISTDHVPTLRAKQAEYCLQAGLCLIDENMTLKDVSLAVRANTVARNRITEDTPEHLANLIARWEAAAWNNMSLIQSLVDNDRSILTAAVQAVVQNCPANLVWESWSPSTSATRISSICYSATTEHDFYAINIVKGIILVNGVPPCTLPNEVKEHQLFERCFGKYCDFEVTCDRGSKRSFLTTRPAHGKYYRFCLVKDELKIEELDICKGPASQENTLELLDNTKAMTWGASLPSRLQTLYSHWLCRHSERLFLRNPKYKEREVFFMLEQKELKHQEDGTSRFDCFKVPLELQNAEQKVLLGKYESFDRLVCHETSVVRDVLSKIENEAYIHSFQIESKGECVRRIELPRFGLSFVRDNGWRCEQLSGYKLSASQHLKTTFNEFSQYIVLETTERSPDTCFPPNQLIVVPFGDVHICPTTFSVSVCVSSEGAAAIRYNKFKIDRRFGRFVAETVASRFQLAALHLGTSSLVPDPFLSMTGEEGAAYIIRQCWTNRALSCAERAAFENLKSLALGTSAIASLLCCEIETTLKQVEFLCGDAISGQLVNGRGVKNSKYHDERSSYLKEVQTMPCSFRKLLSRNEEERLIGQRSSKHSLGKHISKEVRLDECPVGRDVVKDLHTPRFVALPNAGLDRQESLKEFPLKLPAGASFLRTDVHQELLESWDSHIQFSSRSEITYTIDSCGLVEWLASVHKVKNQLSDYCRCALNGYRYTKEHEFDLTQKLLRLANFLPSANEADIAECVLCPENASEFDWTVSVDDRRKIVEAALLWLELCVLEDRLVRVQLAIGRGSVLRANQELQASRDWESCTYPAWLVFEAVMRIQIRPKQFAVAKALLARPGYIVQLNMGEGKTRVIIPMMILHWTFHEAKAKQIPRIHFLSSLIHEGYDYLHGCLSGSIFCCKVLQLPFNRDVELTRNRVEVIKSIVHYCAEENGIVVVAPEHRQSLELKRKELALSSSEEQNAIASALLDVTHNQGWIDLLDESDEMLHTRYQLVYARGGAGSLPSATFRSKAVQALFEALLDESIQMFVEQHTLANWCEDEKGVHLFKSMRLLLGDDSQAQSEELKRRLAKAVISKSPRDFHWLRTTEGIQRGFVSFMVEKDFDVFDAKTKLPEYKFNALLAFRGLLAGGVLFHCLQKKHRVDFGVAPLAKKRLAIPFRGSDNPVLRSEFAQPDCAIVLTFVAYLAVGLSKDEFHECLTKLLEQGGIARREIYSHWFQINSMSMTDDLRQRFDSIDKIDPSNSYQEKALWSCFKRNRYCVSFFLDHCVFPRDLQVYPRRITANSWHLATNPTGQVYGFSGTNDNHRTLPLQLKQFTPEAPNFESSMLASKSERVYYSLLELNATNGKMIERIQECTLRCDKVEESKIVEYIAELSELNCALMSFIDSGAFMAGQGNRKVASKLLSALPHRVQGVCFFENGPRKGMRQEWMILERSGRCMPKVLSPVAELDAFVFFDEPRCRGADIQNSEDTIAVLTLGTRMCKDKLMQAAGRMRMLHLGQKLIVVYGQEVLLQLQKSSQDTISVLRVLQWTLENTVTSNSKQILNWANQGMYFATTDSVRGIHYVEQDEVSSLHDFYGNKFDDLEVSSAVDGVKKHHRSRTCNNTCNKRRRRLVNKIVTDCKKWGQGITVSANVADEECERELEREEEQGKT